MQSLFISATGTNVGKTYTTLLLIKAFASRGIKVGVCKPIETGVSSLPLDASVLLDSVQEVNPEFATLGAYDITAYTFPLPAAPFCADTKQSIKIDTIIDKIHTLAQKCDILLIEGAGGLMVPITENYTMLDLAQAIHSPILLVTPSRLGCINDTLLSIEALKSRNLNYEWCVNLYEDKESFDAVTRPYYDKVFDGWWSSSDGIDAFVQKYIQTHIHSQRG